MEVCVVFIRCRWENWVNLDANCRPTQIHPSMPSSFNIHSLPDERFKHSFLFFWIVGLARGWEGCVFDWFMVVENNPIKLTYRVFFNNILTAIWMVENSFVVSFSIGSKTLWWLSPLSDMWMQGWKVKLTNQLIWMCLENALCPFCKLEDQFCIHNSCQTLIFNREKRIAAKVVLQNNSLKILKFVTN
jgi:hypothetical protein